MNIILKNNLSLILPKNKRFAKKKTENIYEKLSAYAFINSSLYFIFENTLKFKTVGSCSAAQSTSEWREKVNQNSSGSHKW